MIRIKPQWESLGVGKEGGSQQDSEVYLFIYFFH